MPGTLDSGEQSKHKCSEACNQSFDLQIILISASNIMPSENRQQRDRAKSSQIQRALAARLRPISLEMAHQKLTHFYSEVVQNRAYPYLTQANLVVSSVVQFFYQIYMLPIYSYAATYLARLQPIATNHKYNACELQARNLLESWGGTGDETESQRRGR